MKRNIVILILLITVLSGCAVIGGAKYRYRKIAEGLHGTWEESGGTIYKIEVMDELVNIISIVDSDGEAFEVQETKWEEGILSWTYLVPSTEYVVNMHSTAITEDTIICDWQNDYAEGSETLTKISDVIE
ncbi:MAG: hypothetical protein K9N09_03290 [Candidatus Cloacimonetes bacterium]|nr:hypothetical protein [Candidatus Cloacimonadota bacterium]MCF7813408.1 hypothetical protein [Candidatus Cloacimonadota bacterium]MCF7867701.1 hypothetical protein [Candidatus Cloacimonadota bacterium]MCF7883213.1 hypothetical protein [Candidatus Cloacimonadota bacterium]